MPPPRRTAIEDSGTRVLSYLEDKGVSLKQLRTLRSESERRRYLPSYAIMAAATNLSRAQVCRVLRVLCSRDKVLVEAVMNGKVSATTAYNDVREQDQLAYHGEQAKLRALLRRCIRHMRAFATPEQIREDIEAFLEEP
jgi:hypothetical protein